MKKPTKAIMATVAALASVALVAPGAVAAGSYYLHAASDYSRASTSTNGGWQGRSYAQHGNLAVGTGWTTVSSIAAADVGTSSIYAAQVWFR